MGLWMRAPHNRHTRLDYLAKARALLMGCAWPPCTQTSDDGSLQLKSQEPTESWRNGESNSSPWDEALKHPANGKKKLKRCVSAQTSRGALGWVCSLCSVLGFLMPPWHCSLQKQPETASSSPSLEHPPKMEGADRGFLWLTLSLSLIV